MEPRTLHVEYEDHCIRHYPLGPTATVKRRGDALVVIDGKSEGVVSLVRSLFWVVW